MISRISKADDRARALQPISAAALLLSLLGACGGGGGGGDVIKDPPLPQENPGFRAIAGVSMGAYGALNLGTKFSDRFGAIAALGGPINLNSTLQDLAGVLDVKPQTSLPVNVGDDFTFDHLPPYPGRGKQMGLIHDLFIALGNPALHHPDPARQYLAADSEPASLGVDDEIGPFTPPAEPRGFLDGGDANQDGVRQANEVPTDWTDVLLLGGGTLQAIAGQGIVGTPVGGRLLADLNGDGIYDVGDGLVTNFAEPFTDGDGDFLFSAAAGETYEDTGLDGVPGTGDFGEGNGQFDYDPDRAAWMAEDPSLRIASRDAAAIGTQRIYMDVGTMDEFGFGRQYDQLVATLQAKGFFVEVNEGFTGSCVTVPDPRAQFTLVRYPGGHVGIPESDAIREDLLNGNFCDPLVVWQRLLNLFGFLNQAFPDGNFGVGEIDFPIDIDIDDLDIDFDFDSLDLRGDMIERDIESPALQVGADQPVPVQHVLVYLPPKFSRSDADFPIAYVLPGHGMDVRDFERVRLMLDALIITGKIQNMIVAFLPGAGAQTGSFFVNHRIPETQVPDVIGPTSGRYEDSILQDLMPVIEGDIARGRVRR